MEELRRITRAYLDDLRTPIEKLVSEAYDAMDFEKDGLVSFRGFSDHMIKIRRPDLAKKAFFEKLDSDGDGKLDWDDVATLGYAACSGRRFCGGCNCFIEGVYFTCATCFHDSDQPYVLCPACHQNIREHVHHEHKDFIDNFLLLELLRNEKLARKTSNQAIRPTSKASSSEVVIKAKPSQISSSLAIVPAQPMPTPPQRVIPQRFHWRDALTIAGIGVSAADFLLSACSIM